MLLTTYAIESVSLLPLTLESVTWLTIYAIESVTWLTTYTIESVSLLPLTLKSQ